MEDGRLGDDDTVFRHCIYPVSFRGQRQFAHEKLIKLYDQPDGSILASVAWGKYMQTADLVHGYGCRLALRRNDKARSDGTFKENKKHVYCGAYALTSADVRVLAVTEGLEEIFSADLVHHIEDGELAHTDLRITLKPGSGVNIEATKTVILDRLWNACRGPWRHVCPEDGSMSNHCSLSLTDGPRGPYP
jgi:hypothetical protein